MTEDTEPSPEFIKGYNHGYTLAAHEPELLDKILQAQPDNPDNTYMQALAKGKDQYKREQIVAEMKANRERQKQTIRRKM